MRVFIIFLLLSVAGCVKIPEGLEPVNNFDVNRYLGEWYEIARFDHSFERGLQQVTANYSFREDSGIKVLNRGYNEEKNTWEEAEGKAYFVDENDVGYLKVSFFGPFYGAYLIFDLDEDYQYSLVTGSDRSYFWLLSRAPVIDETLKAKLFQKMDALGFDTEALILVEH